MRTDLVHGGSINNPYRAARAGSSILLKYRTGRASASAGVFGNRQSPCADLLCSMLLVQSPHVCAVPGNQLVPIASRCSSVACVVSICLYRARSLSTSTMPKYTGQICYLCPRPFRRCMMYSCCSILPIWLRPVSPEKSGEYRVNCLNRIAVSAICINAFSYATARIRTSLFSTSLLSTFLGFYGFIHPHLLLSNHVLPSGHATAHPIPR